jgi:4-amino-4-deoxy-L-arabinose transferase-like glycosyltransferase
MSDKLIRYLWPYGLLLFAFVIIGLVFGLHNISHYNVYPDSYQSVTVTQNLKTYHRLAAPMGQNGLVYPDFFGWTRPFYPILILLFSIFGVSLFTAAHLINILAGILAIFAVYYFVDLVLKSKKAGLAASLLLTVSYSHAVWGGFVFTESLGVVVLTLALWSLWRSRQINDAWFTNQDLFTGGLFALAVLTRYEYIALLIPAAFLAGAKFSLKRTASIIATLLTSIFLVLALLHPFTGDFAWIWSQIKDFVIIIVLSLVAITLGLLLINNHKQKMPKIEIWATRATLLFIVLGSLAMIVRHSLYSGLWDFANNDPLLCAAALFGLVLLLIGTKAEKRLALTIIAGILILVAVYMSVNPGMERYLTHLTPLILIPAGYGAVRFAKFKIRPFVVLFAVLVLSLQGIKTWAGLHDSDNGIWYKPGYEEVSAKKLKSKVGNTDLLITSMPEPYYLYTHFPTQSVADKPPYVFANIPPQTNLTIVDDEAMRKIFPNFDKFISKNLRAYITDQYWVNESLRYINSISPEKKSVKVYQLKYSELQDTLSSN